LDEAGWPFFEQDIAKTETQRTMIAKGILV